MSLTRKEFIGSLVGGAALLAGCGGGDGGADAAMRNCVMNGTNATISANHGHVITVSAADVTAGVDKTYDIMGTATHTHSVTVTAANFTTLKNNGNGSAQVTSSTTNAHTHTITILCA